MILTLFQSSCWRHANLHFIFTQPVSWQSHVSPCSLSASSYSIISAIVLANSLVTFQNLINIVFHSNELPNSFINCLQVIQNSLAHAIYLSTKQSDNILPVLNKHHWLPVSSCIEFKIATVLQFQLAVYIFDLITPFSPPRSLRSSNKNLLILPDNRFFFCYTCHLESFLFLNKLVPQIHYLLSKVY